MNNMYYNNNPYAGYSYGNVQPKALNTQPLTEEQINHLRQKPSDLSLKVSEDDLLRAKCTHKEKNGNNALIENPDGTLTCSICSKTFKPFDGDITEAQRCIDVVIGMLQTSKMIYLDAPKDLVEQYYQIIPLLEKFPKLWQIAVNNFAKYDGYDTSPVNNNSGFGYGFNAMNQILTNPASLFAGQPQYPYGTYQVPQGQYQQPPMYGNPAYGAYQAGPQYQQQPGMGMPNYQQMPTQQQGNPMAYGAPTAQPAPSAGVIPQTPPTAEAAQATAQQGEVTQNKSFAV